MKQKFTIGLSGILNPDNAAAVMRVMANFGFSNLILIKPKLNIKDINYSIARGGYELLEKTRIFPSLKDIAKDYDLVIGTSAKSAGPGNIVRSYISLDDATELLLKNDTEGVQNDTRILLLFGSEDKGLSNEELKLCDTIIHIPTQEAQRALNLSHSAAIVMHHFYMAGMRESQKNEAIQENSFGIMQGRRVSSKNERELIVGKAVSLYEMASSRNGTEKKSRKRTQEIVWRRLTGKAMLTRIEARAMLGFLSELMTALEIGQLVYEDKEK